MKIKNKLTAYFLIWKRLLKKTGFLILLCLIPVLFALFSHFAKTEDTGLLRIALASRDSDGWALSVMESLKDAEGLVSYSVYPTADEAVQSVYDGLSDGAWVFEDELYEKLRAVARGEELSLVSAYMNEDTVMQKIAREQVYSRLYPEIARIMYGEFSSDELFLGGVSEDLINGAYEENKLPEDLVTFNFQSFEARVEEINYLTAPLRGIISVLVLVCGLCGALYYLCDERQGVYGFVSRGGRFVILLLTVSAALTVAAAVMVLSAFLCGSASDLAFECALAVLYVIGCTGACTVLATLVRNVNSFAVLTVAVLCASLVLSPVFIDISSLKELQVLFAPYHYLYALDGNETASMAIYAAAAMASALLVGAVSSSKRKS